jgi:flagellar basal-body rod modification protein FlgD
MTTPISPVASSSATSQSAAAPAAASASTGMASLLQPTTFLNLLVDELKYQDPLNPTSSSDFMNQIAQLSQVEQLQSVSSSSQISEAASLLSKTVTGVDANGAVITGAVTGVTNGANGPTLDVGGNFINLTSVMEIAVATSATTTTTSTTSTTTTA